MPKKDLSMNETTQPLAGAEHWTNKGDVKLFLWNKCAVDPAKAKAPVLFVHGSSMASQPTFDRQWAIDDKPVNGVYHGGSDHRKDGEAVGW